MCTADADVYYRLFCKVLEDPSGLGHGRTGYYFTENGECVLYDIAKAIGTALVAAGVASEAEPDLFTKEECDKYFGKYSVFDAVDLMFANVRCRADRARRDLGWAPTHVAPEEVLATVPEIVEAAVKRHGLGAKA